MASCNTHLVGNPELWVHILILGYQCFVGEHDPYKSKLPHTIAVCLYLLAERKERNLR